MINSSTDLLRPSPCLQTQWISILDGLEGNFFNFLLYLSIVFTLLKKPFVFLFFIPLLTSI
jgi:hypothetical protein